MQTCNRCRQQKTNDQFAIGSYRCRGCQSQLAKAHYEANKHDYAARNKVAKVNLTNKITQLITDILGVVCQRCGYGVCKQALHCHHKDPSTKLFSLAGRHTSNTEKLVAEISKCVLLCANCHAELHAGIWVL